MSNRTVATDALATLGTIIDAAQKRDAIHLAVDPVIAGERLSPGQHIRVKDGVATATEWGDGLGIVDPFLERKVAKGERFWFVMYPRMVTSLRHVWSHPEFKDEAGTSPAATEKSASEAWLIDFADEFDLSMNALLKAAKAHLSHGDWHCLSFDTPERAYTDIETFWHHYEIVTGAQVPSEKRESFFSCSC